MNADTKQWVAVVGLIFRGDRLLAMRRRSNREGGGIWEGVSGRVRPDEQPLDAVRREIQEESGLAVDVDPSPVDAYSARRRREPMVVIVYRARYEEGEVVLSEEHTEFQWCTLREFEDLAPERLAQAAQAAAQ